MSSAVNNAEFLHEQLEKTCAHIKQWQGITPFMQKNSFYAEKFCYAENFSFMQKIFCYAEKFSIMQKIFSYVEKISFYAENFLLGMNPSTRQCP